MTTLQEAAQRALEQLDIAQALTEKSQHHPKILAAYHELAAALASEPQAEPLMVNGLTEAETSASASVAGLVGQPGAVGLSDEQIFARALWEVQREHEDRCDIELEDVHPDDHLWALVKAACAALATQPVAPGWMPIESAPMDGTSVLLWEEASIEPFVGRWGLGRCWEVDTEHVDTDGDANVISKLWQGGITHWSPLPPPPAATQGAKT